MPRPFIARPALLSLVAACSLAACSDAPTMARPRAGSELLAPRPHSSPTQPVIDSANVHPSAVAVGGLPASDTVTVGTSVSLTVRVLDSAGVDLANLRSRWLVSDAAVASVDSVSGVLQAKRSGRFQIGVAVGDTTAWVGVTAVDSAPPSNPTGPQTPPGGTPSGNSVALQLVRFDGQSGPVTVSSGVPLLPGVLKPGQEGSVHVFVNGAEQPAYVSGLWSRHPDGSLRAVLVQLQVASLASGQPISARLDIADARSAEMTLAAPLATPGSASDGTPKGIPAAALLPTDPAYLVATDLVGPTMTAEPTRALGGVYARYEGDFAKYAEKFWASEGADYAQADYYDRALIYYAMWARTGNATYWARAGQLAYDYRAKYLEPNGYNTSPHWAQLEGIEKHYLLTGDPTSRVAVLRAAGILQLAFLNNGYMTPSAGESRIAARVLHSQLLAWRLAPAGAPAVTGNGTNTNYGANVETAVRRIAAWQQADGSYPSNAVCGGQLNYMVGLLNDALIKTSDYYVPAATPRAALQGTIRGLVQKAVDHLWGTQWVAAKQAFQYASVDCTADVGGRGAAPDLNNLLSAGFGWVYRQTGDAQYRAAGEAIFAGGVTQAYLAGSKQFNENYTSSFRFLAYR